MTYTVATNKPLTKIAAGVLASAVVSIVAWGLNRWAGVELPSEVREAAIVIVGALVAYLTPLQPGEVVPVQPTPTEPAREGLLQ